MWWLHTHYECRVPSGHTGRSPSNSEQFPSPQAGRRSSQTVEQPLPVSEPVSDPVDQHVPVCWPPQSVLMAWGWRSVREAGRGWDAFVPEMVSRPHSRSHCVLLTQGTRASDIANHTQWRETLSNAFPRLKPTQPSSLPDSEAPEYLPAMPRSPGALASKVRHRRRVRQRGTSNHALAASRRLHETYLSAVAPRGLRSATRGCVSVGAITKKRHLSALAFPVCGPRRQEDDCVATAPNIAAATSTEQIPGHDH